MRNAGRALVVLVVGLLSLGAFTAVASAASETSDCTHLQAALDQAQNGDTITLNELCVGSDFNLDNGSTRTYTLEGQSGSGAGFDGTNATTSMVHANNGSGNISVRNLIFKNSPNLPLRDGGALVFQGDYSVTLDHDTFTNNMAPSGALGGAVAIETTASSSTVTITNDTFTGNQAGIAGGALELTTSATSGSISVTNSTFQNNEAFGDTGGAIDMCECGAPLPVTLSHNTFSGNQIVASSGFGGTLEGGAVFLDNSSGAGNAPLTQSGNSFTGNSLSGGTGEVDGGGEALAGATLSSTGDIFTGNSIHAPAGGNPSQGAALSMENNCSASVQDTLTNTAVAGNSIADGGPPLDARGAVNVHCVSSFANPMSVLLRDVTISANKGGGGTAGLSGDQETNATLQNSILTANSDGSDLGGIESPGSAAATYTDLCNGTAPFAGAGNICADPALKDPANGDVHQTSSSPTIDAGSNALVSNGLTTDVYGANRIQPRSFGGTPIVDMGAAEFPLIPAPPTASIAIPSNGAIYAVGQQVNASFSCAEGGGGPGVSSCVGPVANGSPINTSTTGKHTFTVTATSGDGQTGAASVTYTVAAAPSVSLASPVNGARFVRGHQTGVARFSCADGTSGPGLSSCTGTVPNGKPIDTTTPGTRSFTVTAKSSDGQLTTRTVKYRVVFPTNALVRPPHLKPHSDGRFYVTVKVRYKGRVDILVTAWTDNFAPASDIPPPNPVLLRPALKRFVFARAHTVLNKAGTYRILVVPNARGRRLVRHHRYRVTLRLWISYTPFGGHPGKLGYYGLHLP